MNTAYLENFIAIAEERNISAAARRMHIAQSALSTQLKSLEEEMGCMLLKRSSHGVSLSFEGELFYRYARRMLALERELRDQLDDCADGNPDAYADCSADADPDACADGSPNSHADG